MNGFDFLTNFYNVKHDSESIFDDIDRLCATGEIDSIRAFPCFIDKNFLHELESINNGTIELVYSNNEISHFIHYYNQKINKHTIEEKNNKFFLLKSKIYKDIYTVITIGDSYYFTNVLLKLFERNYPRSSLTFITHKKLKRLLYEFKSRCNIDKVTITRTSMRSRVEGRTIPSINWPELDLEKAFAWVEEENGWFQKITFKAFMPKSIGEMELSISRQGVIKTNKLFKTVYSNFIKHIEKNVHNNVEIFSKRARMDNKNRNAKPLYIDLGTDVFAEVNENKRFISSLEKMKGSSVSIIHDNPYINVSLLDFYDGSVNDIWVLDSQYITIVGQVFSSHQSIKRLINHIFDTFEEGEILTALE